MATYKVPQDVEADDKLIGPFSFRQFIYLIIVVLAGVAAWGLAQLFIMLVVIPLPIIVFFGALALPLRKDQPMEIYMAAMVSFYLKPRKRLWDPEGIETLIEITAPKVYEENRTKGLSQTEAEQRLGYLANIVDSGGWAIRGTSAVPSTSINNDIFLEAQSAVDVFDANNSVAQSLNQMMAQTSIKAKEEAVERMKTATFAPTPPPAVAIAAPAPVQTPTPIFAPAGNILPPVNMNTTVPEFNPYPDIQQSVIQPLNDPSHAAETITAPIAAPVTTTGVPQATGAPVASVTQPVVTPVAVPEPVQSSTTTSDTPISADIINLANNADGLSIETVAHEANRIQKKLDEESQEVVISLR
ncbi:MAG: PrgI family protein [Candidatus Microsaccharimonas sp.]